MPTFGLAFFVYGPASCSDVGMTMGRVFSYSTIVDRTQIEAFDDDSDRV